MVCPQEAAGYWDFEMRKFGIDVSRHVASGALTVATGEQWRESPLDSITKARELWQYIDEQLTTHPGVRIAGDASWVQLEPAISSDRLCHWEATADLIYEDAPVKTICMYDLTSHSPSAIRAALRTHSLAVLDGESIFNPFYEAVEILDREPDLNDSEADAPLIESMLASLRASTRADHT